MIFYGGSSLKRKSTGRTTLMPSRSFETRCTIRSRQLWIYLGSESCFRMSQSSTFRNTSRITGSNHTFWKSFYSIMLFLAFKYSCDSAPFNSDLSSDQQSLEWMRLISRAISCEFWIMTTIIHLFDELSEYIDYIVEFKIYSPLLSSAGIFEYFSSLWSLFFWSSY